MSPPEEYITVNVALMKLESSENGIDPAVECAQPTHTKRKFVDFALRYYLLLLRVYSITM